MVFNSLHISVWTILMLGTSFLFLIAHKHAHIVDSRSKSQKKNPSTAVAVIEAPSLYVTAPDPLHVTPIWKRKVSRLTSMAQCELENEKKEADIMFNNILFSGR